MERSGDDLGRHHLAHPHQAAKQVERVDGLGQQHAAAVTLTGAAPRLGVIPGLRAPPRHLQHAGLQFTQCSTRHQFTQPNGAGAEPVLQHHAKTQLAGLCDTEQFFGAFQRHVQRLFHQRVFARRQHLPGNSQVRVGGCGQHHGIHRRVRQNFIQVGGEADAAGQQPLALGGTAAAHTPAPVHAVVQRVQAGDMGL